MELPGVGQQCAQTDCKQLDFLPLQCKCGKQFCSEHFNLHVISCNSSQSVEVEPRKFENIYKCSQDGCDESSLVPLFCSTCQKHYCIKHRHLTQCSVQDEQVIAAEKEKYAAPVRQFNEAKTAVDKHIEQSLEEAKKKGRNISLINKVQLMKIKNKARGLKTIPVADRIYFNVTYPGKGGGDPVFVSKNWSVGRAIDAIADECKLQNTNNKRTEKKLRLFKKGGEIISKNAADILQHLVNNGVIVDGESLIIEYVGDDCDYLKNSF